MKKLIYFALASSLVLQGCDLFDVIVQPSVPVDFYSKTKAKMPLEKKYTALGGFKVSAQAFPSGRDRFKEFKVWYPENLTQDNRPYPVVVFANGTGVPYRGYEAVFSHLASWGFVAIGNNDESSWDGASTSQSLAFLQQQSRDPKSPFYQKLDLNRVGVSGHSQGGVGAINAVSNFDNSNLFRSIYTASTTKHALALALKWPYAIDKVKVPYFMVAGTGHFDGGNGEPDSGIAPLHSLSENYAGISGNGLTVMGRRSGTDHGDMLYVPNGYMAAWFRYTLMNDQEAARVFAGESPEIRLNTENWQNVQIKQSQ